MLDRSLLDSGEECIRPRAEEAGRTKDYIICNFQIKVEPYPILITMEQLAVNWLAKVYDRILCERLNSWLRLHRARGGARKGGCLEHNVTVLLFTREKVVLLINFLDF